MRAGFQYYPFVNVSEDEAAEVLSHEQILDRVLEKLPIRPRRGDVVLDSNERGAPDVPGIPNTDHGYRYNGIYIFNGERLESLTDEPDDYGSIPEEFRVVVEFPPMYWTDILSNSSFVPFNFKKHLGKVDLNYLSQIQRVDGTGSHLAYPFVHQGQVYIIADVDSKNPTQERLQRFVSEISQRRHFQKHVVFRVAPQLRPFSQGSLLMIHSPYPVISPMRGS